MKLKYLRFNNEIEISNDKFNTIVIENRSEFLNLMVYLNYEFIGNVEYLILTNEQEKKLSLDSYLFYIPNIFNLDLNTKKNINALYKKLKNIYGKKMYDDLQEIKRKCEEIIEEISIDFDIELSVGTTINIDDIFKIMNISFSENYMNLKEKLIKYILIINELNEYNVFILNNLHIYFSNEELEFVIKELSYHDISLINIENNSNFEKISNECIKILDIDNCSIE